MNPPDSWIPFYNSFMGTGGALLVAFLVHRFTLDREHTSKAAETRMRRRHRWEEFEEKSLLEFQDRAARHLSCAAKIIVDASLAVAAKPEVNYTSMSANLAEFTETQAIIFNLTTRIRDEKTRTLARDFFEAGLKVREQITTMTTKRAAGQPSNQAPLNQAVNEMQMKFFAVSGRIGDRVRADINAEIAKGEAEAAAERERSANSLRRRLADLFKRIDARVREIH